jgi:hypothetical protein
VGANWYPESRESQFEVLINMRPRHGNTKREVQSETIRLEMKPVAGGCAMRDFAKVRERFMRDSLPVRLGGLAADLARVGSTAINPANARVVEGLLEEARRFVEWTAAETEPAVARQLVDLQVSLTLWLPAWLNNQTLPAHRALLAHQARNWSDQVLALSGLQDEALTLA